MKAMWVGFLGVFFSLNAWAVTVSHSGEELAYEYDFTFRSLERGEPLTNAEARKAAEFHASHLFGIFHSPQVAETHGYPAELIEGFAGTKNPTIVSAQARENDFDKYWWIRYKARGTFVVLRPVAEAWMKRGRVELALLKDLPLIYADDGVRYRSARWRKCTDSYYSAATEFSYFYTPYNCPELLASPFAEETTFRLRRRNAPDADFPVPRDALYGGNGNGKLVTFYFVHGFDSTPLAGTMAQQIHRDYGWKSFIALEKLLTDKFGFEPVEGLSGLREVLGKEIDHLELLSPVTLEHDTQRRYYRTYAKKEDGKIFVARSALFNTDNDEGAVATKSFPMYWKEAWENADFLYFGGHSGDGQALRLKTLLDTLEAKEIDTIRFRPRKIQIAVLDSCSSYAHFHDMYLKKKPRHLHLVSFGLVSLFHLGNSTLEGLLDLLLLPENSHRTWVDALGRVEHEQLKSHVKYYYEPEDYEEIWREFESRHHVPSSLMSVTSESGA